MTIKIKTVDESLTSNDTLQSDNELFLVVGSNKDYMVEGFFLYNAHATPDIKIKWAAPTGSTMTWTYMQNQGDDAISTISDEAVLSGNGSNRILAYRGVLRTSSTSGFLELFWAQNTSSANASIIKAGSYIIAHDISGDSISGGTILKALDETIQSSTTLQNDNELLFAIAANKQVAFTLDIIHTSGTTPDFKIQLIGPSGASIHWARRNFEPDYQDETDVVTIAGAGAVRRQSIMGIIINGSTAGNFQLQWAQNTSDASDTKVLIGSSLIYHLL